MSKLYKNQYIWIYGCCGIVHGWTLERINERIKEWNSLYLRCGDFWDWLSYEEDEIYNGFDCIWNNKNPLMSKVLPIKSINYDIEKECWI